MQMCVSELCLNHDAHMQYLHCQNVITQLQFWQYKVIRSCTHARTTKGSAITGFCILYMLLVQLLHIKYMLINYYKYMSGGYQEYLSPMQKID